VPSFLCQRAPPRAFTVAYLCPHHASRIIESNAVGPGQIGLGDDTAKTLSGLVNLICDKMILEHLLADQLLLAFHLDVFYTSVWYHRR